MTNRTILPILLYLLVLIVSLLNLYLPEILSIALVVVGGFICYTFLRLEQE